MITPYFKEVKIEDVVYGLVFGRGIVVQIFDNDSFYKLIVHFENGREIPYTIDGVSKWGSFYDQTLFYKHDIDLTEYDFTPVSKVLNYKKLIKLRKNHILEVRLPSGIWASYELCNNEYVENLIEKEKFHLFRKHKTF